MKEIPLYQTLYNELVKKISMGEYSEKTPLPSEREICDIYHVSRSTVRKTMEILRYNNYINTIHGSGNYVRPKLYYQPLTKFHSFANYLTSNNVKIINKILSYELIDTDDYLKKFAEVDKMQTKWHKLTRLRLDSNTPLMIETSYLPRNRFYNIDIKTLDNHSLYKYLESFYNMKIDTATEYMSPTSLTIEQADYLEISPKIPCMLLERWCYENDSIIIIHKTIVRGDKYKFKNVYSNNY